MLEAVRADAITDDRRAGTPRRHSVQAAGADSGSSLAAGEPAADGGRPT
jgi:hypothetical protein